MMKFDDAKPNAGRERKRLEDVVTVIKLGGKWAQVRLRGDIAALAQHWIKIDIEKDGVKKETQIPKMCLAHNPDTDEFDKGDCPYCDINAPSKVYLANAISRSEQDNEPARAVKPTRAEAASGIKDHDSNSWTPVVVVQIKSSLLKKIQALKELNTHVVTSKDGTTKSKRAFPVNHDKAGCDIQLRFDKDAKGTDMYQVQKGDKSPLTDAEKAYLIHDLGYANIHENLGIETLKEARIEAEKLKKKMSGYTEPSSSKHDFDDEDDVPIGKRKNERYVEDDVPAKKPKARPRVDDFDDEDDVPPVSRSKRQKDDFDDEDVPVKPRQPKANVEAEKKRSRPKVEDDVPAKKPKQSKRDDFFDDEDDDIPF